MQKLITSKALKDISESLARIVSIHPDFGDEVLTIQISHQVGDEVQFLRASRCSDAVIEAFWTDNPDRGAVIKGSRGKLRIASEIAHADEENLSDATEIVVNALDTVKAKE